MKEVHLRIEDDNLYNLLVAQAKADGRSLTKEIIYIIKSFFERS